MITAQKRQTLTWEMEDSIGTMEVLEIVAIEKGDHCLTTQEGHETRDSSGNILVCTKGSNDEYTWQPR